MGRMNLPETGKKLDADEPFWCSSDVLLHERVPMHMGI